MSLATMGVKVLLLMVQWTAVRIGDGYTARDAVDLDVLSRHCSKWQLQRVERGAVGLCATDPTFLTDVRDDQKDKYERIFDCTRSAITTIDDFPRVSNLRSFALCALLPLHTAKLTFCAVKYTQLDEEGLSRGAEGDFWEFAAKTTALAVDGIHGLRAQEQSRGPRPSSTPPPPKLRATDSTRTRSARLTLFGRPPTTNAPGKCPELRRLFDDYFLSVFVFDGLFLRSNSIVCGVDISP